MRGVRKRLVYVRKWMRTEAGAAGFRFDRFGVCCLRRSVSSPGSAMLRVVMISFLFLSCAALAADRPDRVFADFEGDTYGDWTTTGTAFGASPAKGRLAGQMAVAGFEGKRLVNSFVGGDGATGTLTSPEFTIDRDHIAFLIGGGGHAGKTCLNLVIDGKVVKTATGPNTQPGGSEDLAIASWDVTGLAGKKAKLVIVDEATGGWGHINVDQIVLTDKKPEKPKREIVLAKKYLHFPVKNRAPVRRVSVEVDGKVVREFTIELADGDADWFAPLDVSAWMGKTATIATNALPGGSRAFALISQDDAPRDAGKLYGEAARPQLRFSPPRGWTNDPNGMIYSQGEWHLYYQHNPYGTEWGNMHWAHAVSKDLIHWQEEPIALYPKQFGDWVFSGSAVADRNNTSGWKQPGNHELLVGAYTSTGRGECIVYSNDRGRTWTEYEGNPVVKHAGRDPRLLWHGPSKQWVMAVYTEADKKQWIAFHTSPDLKKWTYRSRIEGYFECPDLFELPLDGDKTKYKWVLTAANSDYQVGTFDGATFKPESKKIKGVHGKGFYAAQTFSHAPYLRVIQMGWFQTPSPGMAFNQSMTVPLELGLISTGDGPRLTWKAAEEYEKIRGRAHRFDGAKLTTIQERLKEIDAELFEIKAEFAPSKDATFTLTVRGIPIRYDADKQELTAHGHKAPAPLRDGKLSLTILADRNGYEVFASDGLTYVPFPVIPKPADRSLSLAVDRGELAVNTMVVRALQSIWSK
jgi:fructan beta-fructosidase